MLLVERTCAPWVSTLAREIILRLASRHCLDRLGMTPSVTMILSK